MWIELDNYVTNDFLESLLHRLLKHSILKYSWIKVSSQMKMKGLNTQHWMTQVSNEWGQWALNMRTRWGCDGPRLGEWGWRRTWGVTSIPKEHGSVTSRPLKGQVTFLKLCLLVVCLVLIIPRFTLFFRPKNAFICLCQRSLFLPAPA